MYKKNHSNGSRLVKWRERERVKPVAAVRRNIDEDVILFTELTSILILFWEFNSH